LFECFLEYLACGIPDYLLGLAHGGKIMVVYMGVGGLCAAPRPAQRAALSELSLRPVLAQQFNDLDVVSVFGPPQNTSAVFVYLAAAIN